MKNLGIYIHIPFCRSKCQYCDFYSMGGARNREAMDKYLQALTRHIRDCAKLSPNYVVDTVYFGGGTPSFFGAEGLEKILSEILKRFTLDKYPEISLEANPDSVDSKSLFRLKRAGFNRISLGIQSDDDEMLKKLGRPHNYQQAKNAVAMARRAGFENVSVDLMFGLPSQTREAWTQTLKNVLELQPDHISCYGLKVEENTPLYEYHHLANLPDDDAQADMYLSACEILEEAGLDQYEISNFARDGFACRHNKKYWLGEEYLGFGPAAASDYAGKRFTIHRDLEGYIQGVATDGVILSECEAVPKKERAGEYLMLRLRTVEGIEKEEYMKSFLLPFAPLEKLLQKYEKNGLALRTEEGRWHLTPKGFLVSNSIIVELLDAQQRSTPLAKKR